MRFTRSISVAAVMLSLAAICAALIGQASPAASHYMLRNVVIGGGGFVTGFVAGADGMMYARTDVGGAYRWNQSTQTWTPLIDFIGIPDSNLFGIESIAVDPENPHRVYLAAGTYTEPWASNGAIFRSSDDGATMDRIDLPIKCGANDNGRSSGERLAVDPNDGRVLYFGSRQNGLWRSGDSGATWAQVSSFPVTGPTDGVGVDVILFQRSTGHAGIPTRTIYAAVSTTRTSLYRSDDAGVTWQSVAGAPVGLMPNHMAFDRSAVLYITYGDQPGPNGVGDGAVWKFDTKTAVWTNITPLPTQPQNGSHFGYGGLAVDFLHPGTLIAATMDRWSPGDEIFRTTDGGGHWVALGKTAEFNFTGGPWMAPRDGGKPGLGNWIGAMAIPSWNPNEAFYGTGGGLWNSTDLSNADHGQSTHWSFADRGFEETVPMKLLSPPVGVHLISGVGDIGSFEHSDLDQSPRSGSNNNPSLSSTGGLDFAESDPSIVVRCGDTWSGTHHGGYSIDGGTSWTEFASEPAGAHGGSIAVTCDGTRFLWTPSRHSAFYTDDRGATWLPAAGLPRNADIVTDRVNPLRCYALSESPESVYASFDGGKSFKVVNNSAGDHPVRLVAVARREGDLWWAAGGTLHHSTDGGATSTTIDTAQSVNSVGFGKAAPGANYPAVFIAGRVGSQSGVFRSDNQGLLWTPVTDLRHQYGWIGPITGDPRIFGRVYFGTGGRGVIYGDINSSAETNTAHN